MEVIPCASAASFCPSGTERSDPRTTSFIYAAEFKVNPITHIVIAGILRNGLINVGIPKYKRNNCGINGVPLKKDT